MIAQAQQPTTPVDEIQMRLFAVIGGEDPQEVIPLVDAQLAVAERELEAIPARAQQCGPDYMQAAAEPMEALLAQFRDYHAWLKQLREALTEQNHQGYVQAYEEAQTLVPALLEQVSAYSKFFASHGAYASPWANTLDRLSQGIVAGQAADESWDVMVAGFRQSFVAKLAEVKATGVPGKTACAEAYQQALEVVEKLQSAESLEQAELKPLFQDLEEAALMGEKIERLMSEGLEGPAAMPVTNVIISVTRKAFAKELDPTLLTSFLDDYCQLLDQFWEGFERSVGGPANSALVAQEIPRTLQEGDQHDAAVEALSAAVKANDQAAAEAALDKLVETASRLKESREVYETAAKHQTHAVCPGCGRANPSENRRCEACGNVLPTEAGGGASSTFNLMSGPALEETQELGMTENVARLFGACDQVADGQITMQEFQAIVQESVAGLKDFAKDLNEIAEEMLDDSQMPDDVKRVWQESHLPYVQEVSAHFVAGIKDVEVGLTSMLAYVNDPDKEHLVHGVRTVWEGLGVIHRSRLAMNANLQMFHDMLEEARERGLVVDAPLTE